MIVEFVGAPGAGKTTLIPTLLNFFREQAYSPYTVVDAARPFAARTIPGKFVTRLAPASLQRPLLWKLFYHLSVLNRFKFSAGHAGMMFYIVQTQRKRPAGADVRERKVWHWFIRMTGYYEFLKGQMRPNEVVVFDEGFLHRVVQLYSSVVETPDAAQIAAYVAQVPQPDLVVYVHASPDICESRILSRGLWKRMRKKQPHEITQFVTHAHQAVKLAVDDAREQGWNILQVNNEGNDVQEAQAALRRQLALLSLASSKTTELQAA